MRLLRRLFGGGHEKIPDGSWLDMDRNGAWTKVETELPDRVVEIAMLSCFARFPGTFFIFRNLDTARNTYAYIAAVNPADSDEILIIVDRIESPTGSVIKKDNFARDRMLDKSSGYGAVATTAKNLARFNGFNTEPPYISLILTGAGLLK